MSLNLGSPNAEDGDEPALEPINGQVFPPFMPRADKPGRVTNQLKYLRDVVIKVRIPKNWHFPLFSNENWIKICENAMVFYYLPQFTLRFDGKTRRMKIE